MHDEAQQTIYIPEAVPPPMITSPPALRPCHRKVGAQGRLGRGAAMLIHLHSQATAVPVPAGAGTLWGHLVRP